MGGLDHNGNFTTSWPEARDRLVAEPYIQAVYGEDPIEHVVMRAAIVNDALYEWALAQQEGRRGFQRSVNPDHPMGTAAIAVAQWTFEAGRRDVRQSDHLRRVLAI